MLLFLSNAIALNMLYSFNRTWPLWIGQLIGGVITCAIFAVLLITGGTLMNAVLRILIVTAFLWVLLTPPPNSPRAREMAKWRQKQESPK